nr:prenatal alcohol-1 [Mus musculus]
MLGPILNHGQHSLPPSPSFVLRVDLVGLKPCAQGNGYVCLPSSYITRSAFLFNTKYVDYRQVCF